MGGGGSGKSVFAARKILERASCEKNHRFLVVRKVAISSECESERLLCRHIASGFSFEGFSFNNFSFGTGVRGRFFFNPKSHNLARVKLKFYSDEINRPFGLYEAAVEYSLGKKGK